MLTIIYEMHSTKKEILRVALMPINKRLELNREIRKRSTIYPLH